MKAIVSLFLILASVSLASAKPFIVIVRHAEKATNDKKNPDLSAAGLARADALAKMLKTSGIVSIFTSELKRTIETAAPTAKSLGINPTVIPAKDTAALVAKLRKLTGNALVVNHSDSIPGLIKALGIDTPVEKIQENNYSEFFVVTLGSKPQLLHLHYPDVPGSTVKVKRRKVSENRPIWPKNDRGGFTRGPKERLLALEFVLKQDIVSYALTTSNRHRASAFSFSSSHASGVNLS